MQPRLARTDARLQLRHAIGLGREDHLAARHGLDVAQFVVARGLRPTDNCDAVLDGDVVDGAQVKLIRRCADWREADAIVVAGGTVPLHFEIVRGRIV